MKSGIEPLNIVVPESEKFGFCRGVVAADILLKNVTLIANDIGVSPVIGYNDIVHNETVKQQHIGRGVQFISHEEDIPANAVVVGSAHGNGPIVKYKTEERGGLYFEGACPLVIRTHKAAQRARETGSKVLYIISGKPGETAKLHDEVAGMVGHMDYAYDEGSRNLSYAPVRRSYLELTDSPEEVRHLLDDSGKYIIVSQTTLDARRTLKFRGILSDSIKKHQPEAEVLRIDSKDVCRAVSNRQHGVDELMAARPDSLVVVTDENSKNGMGYFRKAKQIADTEGLDTNVLHVAGPGELPNLETLGTSVAITASASTPDTDTRAVVEALGGLPEQVRANRPSFRLNGASVGTIRSRITDWKTNTLS